LIIGHQKIIEFLNKSIENDRLAHAYLFVGPEHIGKKTAAMEFIKALQCNNIGKPSSRASSLPGKKNLGLEFCGQCQSCREINKSAQPDVSIIEPEIIENKGKKREQEINIGQIRELQHQLSLFSFGGKYKIAVINKAERMSREAANALLKTLEEPTRKTIIILISSAPQMLLPTIVSRCLQIKFLLVKREDIRQALAKGAKNFAPPPVIENISRLAIGKPGLAISFFENPEMIENQEKELENLAGLFKKDLNWRFQLAENLSKDADLAQRVLSQWIMFFRDILLMKAECQSIIANNISVYQNKVVRDILEKGKLSKFGKIIKQISQTRMIISNSSFNARLALEVLMLNL
jgi:DNA polymerase-3 subunit delta'